MRNILKQTSWLFFSQALTRVISFFYIIYLARNLDVSDFGLYTVALAYFSIISSFADFGFNRFLIREVAKDRSKASQLLWNIVVLRLTLTSIFFAIFAIILYILDPDKMRVSLTLLATLAILPQAVAFSFDAIFVALRKLQFSAISFFISSLFTFFAGLFLVKNGFGVTGAADALIFGQLVYAIVLIIFLYKNQGLVLSAINLTVIKKAILGSLPYGLLGILGLLYFRIDVVLISYIRGSFEAGIYGAAYKFLEAVTFIPSAFSVALFPVLARIHESSPQDIKKLYFRSFKIMLMAGLVVLTGYLLVLPEVIKLILPNYLSSIEAIKILALSIPFMFIAAPGVQVILSSEKHLKLTILLSIFTVAFNIILNLIFIPKSGFIAASWVTVASDILSFIIFYLLITRRIFTNEKN